MMIWINGAFGSGKTQSAFELHRRLPDSFVYDPENIGYFMRSNEPKSLQKPDFQDEPLWRRMNFEMLEHMAKEYQGTLIVPMTIYREDYFDEIIGSLRRAGIQVDHYVLGASEETLLKRLRSRMDGKSSWPALKIRDCISGFRSPVFEKVIDTNGMTVDQVVERIAFESKIKLLEDNRSPFRKWADRKRNQILHIRF